MNICESKLRREARKHGYVIRRSRRAESSDNFGHWMIIDADRNVVVAGVRFDMTDEAVARFLVLPGFAEQEVA